MCDSNADRWGQWAYTGFCHCPEGDYVCEHVTRYQVPVSPEAVRGLVDTGRFFAAVLTLGISTLFNGGIRELSHDCVELRVRCTNCGRIMRWTTDLRKGGGIEQRYGEYKRVLRTVSSTSIYVPLTKVKRALPTDDSFDLVNHNCGHYARDAYYAIIRAE
jgi:hypothetical protein